MNKKRWVVNIFKFENNLESRQNLEDYYQQQTKWTQKLKNNLNSTKLSPHGLFMTVNGHKNANENTFQDQLNEEDQP